MTSAPTDRLSGEPAPDLEELVASRRVARTIARMLWEAETRAVLDSATSFGAAGEDAKGREGGGPVSLCRQRLLLP